jgi:hypothetical protein
VPKRLKDADRRSVRPRDRRLVSLPRSPHLAHLFVIGEVLTNSRRGC